MDASSDDDHDHYNGLPDSEKTNDDEQRLERLRERNREHAKRTRLRKKARLALLQARVNELQKESLGLQTALNECETANVLMGLAVGGNSSDDEDNGQLAADTAGSGHAGATTSSRDLKRSRSCSTTDDDDADSTLGEGDARGAPTGKAASDDVDIRHSTDDENEHEGGDGDEEHAMRRARNRQHARQLRGRKKEFVDALMSEVAQLEAKCANTRTALKRQLERALSATQADGGGPIASVALAPAAAAAAETLVPSSSSSSASRKLSELDIKGGELPAAETVVVDCEDEDASRPIVGDTIDAFAAARRCAAAVVAATPPASPPPPPPPTLALPAGAEKAFGGPSSAAAASSLLEPLLRPAQPPQQRPQPPQQHQRLQQRAQQRSHPHVQRPQYAPRPAEATAMTTLPTTAGDSFGAASSTSSSSPLRSNEASRAATAAKAAAAAYQRPPPPRSFTAQTPAQAQHAPPSAQSLCQPAVTHVTQFVQHFGLPPSSQPPAMMRSSYAVATMALNDAHLAGMSQQPYYEQSQHFAPQPHPFSALHNTMGSAALTPPPPPYAATAPYDPRACFVGAGEAFGCSPPHPHHQPYTVRC